MRNQRTVFETYSFLLEEGLSVVKEFVSECSAFFQDSFFQRICGKKKDVKGMQYTYSSLEFSVSLAISLVSQFALLIATNQIINIV